MRVRKRPDWAHSKVTLLMQRAAASLAKCVSPVSNSTNAFHLCSRGLAPSRTWLPNSSVSRRSIGSETDIGIDGTLEPREPKDVVIEAKLADPSADDPKVEEVWPWLMD